MIVVAFFLVPSNWFQMRAGNLYLANLGYATKLHDRNCQVLIYGDSGAMVGLDPAILLQRTGFSACNIAEFEGMTLVNQTLPLDIFLAHNPAPRYLIFLYAPSNLTISRSWSNIGTFEAISFRLQQRPDLSTAWLLVTHPSDTMKWVEGGLRLALTRTKAKPFPSSAAHLRERDDGQLKVPTAHTLTACDPRVFTNLPDRAWLNRLRSQYTTPTTTVLIDAIPTATCNPNNAWNEQHLQGIVDDAPLPHYPFNAYTEEGVEHTNAYGSQLISNFIADQLQTRIIANR